jgi:RsiW-degrading membrane proteinase PrsW (M82 family)
MLALAVFPALVLAIFIYRKDKFQKEPLGLLAKAFFFGCLSAVPAVFLERFFSSLYIGFGSLLPDFFGGIYNGYVVAGNSEELCKLIFLSLAVWRSRHFDEYFDGIVYAAFVSLGFASLENVLYVFAQDTFASALMTGSVRAVLSVPGHFLFGVAMGYFFALAKFQPEHRKRNLLLAYLVPMLLHGTFDALLMIPEAMGEDGSWLSGILFPLFLFFDFRMWKICMKKLRHLQELSEQQAYKTGGNYSDDEYGNGTSGTNYGNYGNNGNGGDAFSGFNWDV